MCTRALQTASQRASLQLCPLGMCAKDAAAGQVAPGVSSRTYMPIVAIITRLLRSLERAPPGIGVLPGLDACLMPHLMLTVPMLLGLPSPCRQPLGARHCADASVVVRGAAQTS